MDYQNNQPGGIPPQQAGYQQPGYPPQGGAGYQQQPGYPPQGGTGYQQQPGYPPQGGTGYQQQPGYPPQGGTGYQQQPAYPPQGGTGYQQQPGYPPQGGTNYQQQPGYPPQGGPDYQQQPFEPLAQQNWGYQAPPKEPKPKRDMSGFRRVLVGMLFALALGAGAWFLYDALVPDATPYGVITSNSLKAHYSGDCIIVRDETPFDAEGVTSVQYKAEEGSMVTRTTVDATTGTKRSTPVCEVYSAGYSTREMTTLQSYRDAIRDYQKELLSKETTYDVKMARVQNDVLTRAKEVRAMIAGASGSLSNQEKLLQDAIDARQQYLKQKYSDDQRLGRLYDDERSQMQRIESWTKSHVATKDGLVSFYSDGYEYALTSKNYLTFTPRQVRELVNGRVPEKSTAQKGKTTIYRIVENNGWNVLFLARETDWNPVRGQTYQLKLERFESTLVEVTVEDFTRSDGELLLYLSVATSVKPVLYMRSCQATLGESIATLCVPKRAITQQNGNDGVTVVTGSTESFIPVNVIWEQGNDVHINAIQQGLLAEGMTIRLY